MEGGGVDRWSELPDDLLFRILRLLDGKSLFRTFSVSKQWLKFRSVFQTLTLRNFKGALMKKNRRPFRIGGSVKTLVLEGCKINHEDNLFGLLEHLEGLSIVGCRILIAKHPIRMSLGDKVAKLTMESNEFEFTRRSLMDSPEPPNCTERMCIYASGLKFVRIVDQDLLPQVHARSLERAEVDFSYNKVAATEIALAVRSRGVRAREICPGIREGESREEDWRSKVCDGFLDFLRWLGNVESVWLSPATLEFLSMVPADMVENQLPPTLKSLKLEADLNSRSWKIPEPFDHYFLWPHDRCNFNYCEVRDGDGDGNDEDNIDGEDDDTWYES